MKCLIANRLVRLFGRAIHCLSRMGDELFLEALKDGLALRTVNSSRSAYACFVFKSEFFVEYKQGCDEIDSSNPAEMLKCKISMKSVLAIFKSLATIEKTVEHCKIEFKPNECRLIFTLYCKHGIVKTHNLTYQECESLQAVFAKEMCPNLIQTQAKVLLDTVCNFPNSCEEISVTVTPSSVKIKNFVDDESDPMKVVHTEMSLVPEEFDDFQIGIDTAITFCLKELRAILLFSEFANQPVSLHFEHPGKPIVFSLDNDILYTGDFVMATLAETPPTQQENSTLNNTTVDRTTHNNTTTTTNNRNITGRSSGKTQTNSRGRKQQQSANIIQLASSNNTITETTDDNDQMRIFKRRRQENADDEIVGTQSNSKSKLSNMNTSKYCNNSKNNTLHRSGTTTTTKTRPQRNNAFGHNNTNDNESQNVPTQEEMLPISLQDDDFFSPTFPIADIVMDEECQQQQQYLTDPPNTVNSSQMTHRPLSSQRLNTSSVLRNKQNKTINDKLMESLLEDEDDDVLMGTPPPSPPPQQMSSRRSKQGAFFSSVLSPVKVAPTKTVLLAADTDDESD